MRYLAALAQSGTQIVTVPYTKRGWQPLCAVYRRQFRVAADRALALGTNRIDRLYGEVEVRTVGDEELRGAGFSEDMFRNLNTPEDWENAKRELQVDLREL